MRPVFLFPRATIIDCGASRTTMAVFSGGRTGLMRLERFATETHASEPGSEGRWLEKTSDALHALRAKIEPAGPVTVVLPPQVTLMKQFSTPRVKAAKRDKIINFESQQSIPYPLADVVWDRLIASESALAFNVLLCAAKREAIEPLCAALAAAGLTPTVLRPSVQALVSGFRETQARQDSAVPTLLINLGARSTTLVLLEKTGFQARSLALAGAGEGAPAGQLLANRLVQEITRTLVHFHQPSAGESSLRVMLTGGGARLPGLAARLATQLAVPVILFDALSAIEFGSEAAEFKRDEHQSTFAEVVGAAALQLRTKQAGLNLLPLQLRQQAGRRRLRPWLAVAAGLAVAALVPQIAHQRGASASAYQQNTALEHELRPLRIEAARNLEKRQRLTEMQLQQEAGRKITAAQTGWGRFLGEMQERFHECGEVWLERMQELAPANENAVAKGSVELPRRIAFSGVMRSKIGEDSFRRVRSLLENIATVPAIAAVEGERLVPGETGLLRFDFVVVLKESAPL